MNTSFLFSLRHVWWVLNLSKPGRFLFSVTVLGAAQRQHFSVNVNHCECGPEVQIRQLRPLFLILPRVRTFILTEDGQFHRLTLSRSRRFHRAAHFLLHYVGCRLPCPMGHCVATGVIGLAGLGPPCSSWDTIGGYV